MLWVWFEEQPAIQREVANQLLEVYNMESAPMETFKHGPFSSHHLQGKDTKVAVNRNRR